MQVAEQIVALAGHCKLPAFYDNREYAKAGGLARDHQTTPKPYRLASIYTVTSPKGAKPADFLSFSPPSSSSS